MTRRTSGMCKRFACVLGLATMAMAFPASAHGWGAGQDPPTPAAPEAQPTPEPAPVPRLTSPEVQEDTLTEADEPAGKRNVNVSFGNNFIADRLPFDVPFNVTGTVDQAVRRLTLSVYRVKSDKNLAGMINDLQKTVDCVVKQPPGDRVSLSSVTPASNGQFSLLVNPLDPQYYYAFCFVGATPIPTSEFEADARRILASVLSLLRADADVPRSLLDVVHGAMRDRIARLGAGRPVRASIPPGNMFAEGAKPERRFGELAIALAEAYNNLAAPLDNYNAALGVLLKSLATARSGPAKNAFTPELVAQLPSASRPLPTAAAAVVASPQVDRAAYTFDGAIDALDQAKATFLPGSPAAADDVDAVKRDLQEVNDAAKQYFLFFDKLHVASGTFMSFVELEARAVNVTLGSSVLGGDLARSVYVSLDAGLAYPWRLENMVFYAGTNIYLRPINKAAPLRYKGSFLHRFSLTVGITTTVKDESRRAEDLRSTPNDEDTSNSLLLGGGIRVTPSMRLGAGVLVFRESDPNPLIDQKSVTVTPYVSFAADVDVAQMFRSLF